MIGPDSSQDLILVFDVGTQGLRGSLIDKDGTFRAFVRETYDRPYYSLGPNLAEQSPDFYFAHLCAVGKKLRDEAPDAFARVRGVTVTVFRDTTVCLDADGKPLRDCILWMDQRRAEHPKQLSAARRALFSLVGMSETIRML